MNIQFQITQDRFNWEDVFQTSSINTAGGLRFKPFHAPQYFELAQNNVLFLPEGAGSADTDTSWHKNQINIISYSPYEMESSVSPFLLSAKGVNSRSVIAEPVNGNLKQIGDLSEDSIKKLGEYGYSRFKEFRNDYKDGWDFGQGKALSGYSAAILDLFLNKFRSFPTDPSIFLTTDGYLQLIWEDKYGQEIIIEFTPAGFVYYIERLDEEGKIQTEDIETLLQKVI